MTSSSLFVSWTVKLGDRVQPGLIHIWLPNWPLLWPLPKSAAPKVSTLAELSAGLLSSFVLMRGAVGAVWLNSHDWGEDSGGMGQVTTGVEHNASQIYYCWTHMCICLHPKLPKPPCGEGLKAISVYYQDFVFKYHSLQKERKFLTKMASSRDRIRKLKRNYVRN